jgi:hypothetical protein
VQVASFAVDAMGVLLERRRAGAAIQLVWEFMEHIHHTWSLSDVRAPMALDIVSAVHAVVAA